MRMPPFAFSLLVSALVLVGCSGSGNRAAPPASALGDLSNPLEVKSSNGLTILHLNSVLDPHTGAPAFAYQGSELAPTIRVNPGDTIDLTYENDLPPSSSDPLNMTNLHFHGLEAKLLMDFRDPIIRGTFMFHCHVLEHEDGGMMAKVAVQ